MGNCLGEERFGDSRGIKTALGKVPEQCGGGRMLTSLVLMGYNTERGELLDEFVVRVGVWVIAIDKLY